MKPALLFAFAALAACESTPVLETKCLPIAGENEKRAQFILACAEAANPRSDEEGEDLVAQCQRTADATFCASVVGIYADNGWDFNPCDGAVGRTRVNCAKAGWVQP